MTSDPGDAAALRAVRGTVILCDQLYPTTAGKWIIAGTYTGWTAPAGARVLQLPPLHVYVRFQVEQAGTYDAELLVVERAMPANQPPVLRQQVQVRITDPLTPCELASQLPSVRIELPQDAGPEPHAERRVPLLLCLRVGEADIASCPLNILFPPAG